MILVNICLDGRMTQDKVQLHGSMGIDKIALQQQSFGDDGQSRLLETFADGAIEG